MFEPNLLARAWAGFLDMSAVQQFALVWSGFLLGVIYLGAAAGLGLAGKRHWPALALLVMVILYFIVLSSGGDINYRFRTPIVPFLAILGGTGYAVLIEKYFHYVKPALLLEKGHLTSNPG